MFGIEIPALLSANLLDYGRKALSYLAVFVSGFLAGYLLCWHNNSVSDAEKKGVQKTAQTALVAGGNAIDGTLIDSRNGQIKDLTAKNAHLNLLLEKAKHESPATDACRLPDGVRSELNRQLGAD